MAKKEEAALQSVVLTCILSGLDHTPGPGDVIEVDAEEAARLLSIGAAKPVEAPAAAATE